MQPMIGVTSDQICKIQIYSPNLSGFFFFFWWGGVGIGV
jgi:hypothetical protein